MGSVPIVPNSSIRNVYIGERVLIVNDLTKVSLLYCIFLTLYIRKNMLKWLFLDSMYTSNRVLRLESAGKGEKSEK